MLERNEAIEKLNELITNPALINHCLCVEAVMKKAATVYGNSGEDADRWGLAGLLHDADWEMFTDTHPNTIVKWLNDRGETDIAYAISAHFTEWGVSYITQMDRALVACDELTGFIGACARLRPDGVMTLEAKSVIKKLKNAKFAAGVSRAEVAAGVELLGCDLAAHIEFIIGALREMAVDLGLDKGTVTG